MIWKTKSTYIDIETGEVLKVSNLKELNQLGYYLIKRDKTLKINKDENNGIIKFTNICRRIGKQRSLFGE